MSTQFFKAVNQKIQEEFLDYKGTGISILETSHRNEIYVELHNKANDDVRKYLNVPDDFAILWFQAEKQLQYSAVCLNLLNNTRQCSYVITGDQSREAYEEGKRLGKAQVALDATQLDLNKFNQYSNSLIQTRENDSFLFYVDEDDESGLSMPFTPRSKLKS